MTMRSFIDIPPCLMAIRYLTLSRIRRYVFASQLVLLLRVIYVILASKNSVNYVFENFFSKLKFLLMFKAEAEYEALKGLLEENILQKISAMKEESGDPDQKPSVTSRLVARKSTDPTARTSLGDRTMNVARKSTGPYSKCWPETRIEIPYSFYGIASEPLDTKMIKTRMAMGKAGGRAEYFKQYFIFLCLGGIEITLDAEKMGELINLKPKLVLEDCNQENVMNPS